MIAGKRQLGHGWERHVVGGWRRGSGRRAL